MTRVDNSVVRVAIGQVESVRDPNANLEKARAAVEMAASADAKMIIFPEYLMSWGPGRHDREAMAAVAQRLDGDFVAALCDLARATGQWIIGGIIEANNGGAPFNTTVVVDGSGRIAGSYRKSHLFDAFSYRESAAFSAGDRLLEPMETPLGCTGLFVCYELRFPEIARSLAKRGATVLIVPSAWVMGPFKDRHWHTLITSRAIENGCYVLAAAQTGNEFSGQSIVVDPMGTVAAEASEAEGVILADVDPARVDLVRDRIPSLMHRRPELYEED